MLNGIYSETCPVGMRKIYLDETNMNPIYGARLIPLSIAYYEALGGALWYKSKILIEPRFEVHLKVTNLDLTKIRIHGNKLLMDLL